MSKNAKLVIEITKFVGALATGATIGFIAFPAVKKFFKLDTPTIQEVTPSEDITEDEIPDED